MLDWLTLIVTICKSVHLYLPWPSFPTQRCYFSLWIERVMFIKSWANQLRGPVCVWSTIGGITELPFSVILWVNQRPLWLLFYTQISNLLFSSLLLLMYWNANSSKTQVSSCSCGFQTVGAKGQDGDGSPGTASHGLPCFQSLQVENMARQPVLAW